MRYQEYFTPATDAELYRLELHESLEYVLPLIKKQAEAVLGCKIRLAKPIGAVNDPVRFSEDSEVDVAFYLNGLDSNQINEEMTSKLQEHFANLPVEDIGVINAFVMQRG
jgi:hypothetical protein